MVKLMTNLFNSSAVSFQDIKEQWAILAASFITMLIIGFSSTWAAPSVHPILLVASIGASVVLVFVLPNSPVSQPYPLIMGQLLCAVIGVTSAYLPFDLYVNAAMCVGACILAMFLFNCMHPPGGATALMPVIVGAPAVGGYSFVLFPVLSNMLVLVILGMVFHRWWLKQDYPSKPLTSNDAIHKHKDASPLARLGIEKADLQNALHEFDAYLNITEKDLSQVYSLAQQKAYARKFGEICCEDIMSRDVVTVSVNSELEEAWALLREHKVKLLPVVDNKRNVIGIISLVDFLKRADLKHYDGFAVRLERFIKRDPNFHNNKPKLVGQIMASPAFTVHQSELITSLVPLLSDKGLHHIPVVNDDNQLTGIVTQSDLIAALYTSSITMGTQK